MFVNVRFGVLNGDGSLFVPPIRLRQYAAIDHGEPVVAPEIDVNFGPVAVIANLLRIEHKSAVDAGAGDIGFQTGLRDDRAIALGELLAEFSYVRVVFAGEDFAEGGQARGHRYAIGVVGAAVEHLVLGDQIHHRAARSEGTERQATTDGLRKADHVGLHAKKFAGAAPGELGAGFHFVEDE